MLSLCSGTAGLELGLRLVVSSARVVCYVEREIPAVAVLAARMADGVLEQAPVWTDVATFDGRPWRGVVDCVTGGYPCQPFSSAGRRLGAADPRHVWPHIARIVAEVEPAICFFENVGAHLGNGFQEVRSDLLGLGFRVAAELVTAAELGAPHLRQRLFILAHHPGRWERRLLANTGGQRAGSQQSANWNGRSAALTPEGGGLVGHAASQGWARRQRATSVASGITEQPERRRRAVGHAHYAGLEGGPSSEPEGWPAAWPPGPGEREQWAAILRHRPDLAPAVEVEPAVRRVADGRATRVGVRPRAAWEHRLQALGNAVVPACAAVAFAALWHELAAGGE